MAQTTEYKDVDGDLMTLDIGSSGCLWVENKWAFDRATAGQIGAALTHFSNTGELPEEVEEDADCADCCKELPVYDFAPAPSRHQRAAEALQKEWERGEKKR